MIHRKELALKEQKLIIETGKMAKQANGAVWIQLGDTVVLVAVVASKTAVEGQDFFPLQVEYREKAYAVGKIPGGFFKREGKPSETEILSARLVDRPIRPLFPKGFKNEVQVLVTVLSADRVNDADSLGITGASAALCLSDIPFDGPIAGARVGRVKDEFVINPSYAQRSQSDLDLLIAGSEDSILMVEGEANQVSEQDMLAALNFGHDYIKQIIQLQKEIVAVAGKSKMEITAPEDMIELQARVRDLCTEKLKTALRIADKESRRDTIDKLVESIQIELAEAYPEKEIIINETIFDVEREIMRRMVLDENSRLDGRGLDDIRDITIEIGLLPRAHGSALFTRGQTQALAATTLGTKIDEQRIEGLEGDFWKNYMLHYNFPPFATGEVKPLRGTSRREIGHGNLAERAIKPVIPSDKVFPYTIRIVSDILESNGSSSMASICAGSLSLMDAGVPIKSPIAGIAMGLVKEQDRVAVLTDILGDEDHMGDMDFKVAGNREGITAVQMDIKIKGISTDLMHVALEKAKLARVKILDIMIAALPEPRKELSVYAPRILSIKIPVDSIGTVIGPGGKMIRDITERSGATINIDDDGTVTIASVDSEAVNKAHQIIKDLTSEPEIGTIYNGKVKKIMKFGAFVEIMPGREGLLHVSEIDHHRVERVEDVLKVGDEVQVKLMKISPDGKYDLSRKVLLNRDNK
jgi:polyribonucleotide nucleotidyltransferase